MESIQKQLEDLGLTPNEVKVYLASLESGPATAQQIAAKAAVVRPTAYVAIGGLSKRGLMSSHTRGKKQYFQAERPARLLKLLEDEKKKIVAQESKLKTLLPGLESLLALTGERTEVKYLEGWDGLEMVQKTLLDSGAKRMDVFLYDSIVRAETNKLPAEKTINFNIELKSKGIGKRQIIVGNRQVLKKWRPFVHNPKTQYKLLQSEPEKLNGEVAIFGEYVSLIAYGAVPQGCLIKNASIAGLIGKMFETVWGSKAVKDLLVE